MTSKIVSVKRAKTTPLLVIRPSRCIRFRQATSWRTVLPSVRTCFFFWIFRTWVLRTRITGYILWRVKLKYDTTADPAIQQQHVTEIHCTPTVPTQGSYVSGVSGGSADRSLAETRWQMVEVYLLTIYHLVVWSTLLHQQLSSWIVAGQAWHKKFKCS